VLESTAIPQDAATQPNYCIATLQNGKMWLTPITQFLQMRPSFTHVDEEIASRQVGGKRANQENQPKRNTQQLVRTQLEEKKVEKKADMEEWLNLKVSASDQVARLELMKLVEPEEAKEN